MSLGVAVSLYDGKKCNRVATESEKTHNTANMTMKKKKINKEFKIPHFRFYSTELR